MFLNGTAMSGGKDHGAIADATFLGPACTAARYRFVAVRDEYPGLLPVDDGGVHVVGELYELTEQTLFGSLLPGEPPELEIGTITLADGAVVSSMQLQLERVPAGDKVVDISTLGGWPASGAFHADQEALVAVLAGPS